MIRLQGVPSIVSKTAQEEGRVLETVLRKGASVTTLLRIPGVLNIMGLSQDKERGPMLGKEASVRISLRQRVCTN